MTTGLGLYLRFTLLTQPTVFALFSERTQRQALYQHIFVPVCTSLIQEQFCHLAFECFGGPVLITPTTSPNHIMTKYPSDDCTLERPVSSHGRGCSSSHHIPAPPPRSVTDPVPYSDKVFDELRASIEDGSFFSMDEYQVLHVLKRSFGVELRYLKSAYVAGWDPADVSTKTPSKQLFERHIPEVDRTLTGILALRWLRNNAYDRFTQNQKAAKLSYESFQELREFFKTELDGYQNHEAVFTLIVMQMTNDLGKSSELARRLEDTFSPWSTQVSANHDVVMEQVLVQHEVLVPAIYWLPSADKRMVHKLIRLSAGFNPGQLVQAECPPAALSVIQELHITPAELNMKFMELFLDVAGARGHVDHNGSMTMIEPVYQGYMRAKLLSLKVAGGYGFRNAYIDVLKHRLNMLSDAGYHSDTDISEAPEAFAKARLFCMARVANAETAWFIDGIYENLPLQVQHRLEEGLGLVTVPAVLPTYMPGMLALVKGPNQDEQLAALFIYLSDVLNLTEEDLQHLPADAEIVERDIKDILEPLIRSKAFHEDPSSVVNEYTELPRIEIAKRVGRTVEVRAD